VALMSLADRHDVDRPEALDLLRGVPGVDRVLVDPGGGSFAIVCDPLQDSGLVLAGAAQALAEAGLDGIGLEALVQARSVQRRARFEGVSRTEEPERMVRMRVALSRDGREVVGEAVGERGEPLEMRAAAAAALDAVERLAAEPLGLVLAGVKQLRAFDAELIVVSLYGPGTGRKLLGVVLAGNDVRRAAAIAVLHALNRVLGNYLTTR
jgi:hypothetical protein